MLERASPHGLQVPAPPVSRPAVRVAAFAAWLAVVAWLSFNHAFWRDEVRAFSLAVQGETLAAMLRDLHGEGHPALWYLLLRAAHAVLRDPVALPLVSIAVASAAMLLLLLRSPFSPPLLAALIVGKFALFEYAVMARNYGISMALLFALAVLYPRHRRGGPVLGILLFLLANTNVHSALLVAAFLLFHLVETLQEHGLRWTPALRAFTLNALLAILGVALCAATVYPPVHTAAADAGSPVGGRRLLGAITLPANQFSELVLHGPWSALGLGHLHEFPYADGLRWIMSLAMFGSLFGLVRRPAAFLAALAALLSLSVFFTAVYGGSYRHQALWLVFLVALYWIAMAGGRGQGAPPGKLGPLIGIASRLGFGLFALLVALQVPGGVMEITDAALHRPPFSRSRDLAALVSGRPELAGATILADPDYLVESVPYYLDNPVYLIRERRFGSIPKFTKTAQLHLTLDDILAAARGVAAGTGRPVLILLAERLDASAPARVRQEGYNWELATTPEQVRAFQQATCLLASFGPARSDESFDVYRLGRCDPAP